MLAAGVFVAAGVFATSPGIAAPWAALALGAVSQHEPVTFWAHPYPYGYAYTRSQCWRRVEVETATGWRWKRIWFCR